MTRDILLTHTMTSDLLTDPIVRKETILDKLILSGLTLTGGDGKGTFATDTHQHSYTAAFGLPERREGIWLLDHPVAATFHLPPNFKQHTYELKLLAMMEQWRNRSAHIAIALNGHTLRDAPMLFENVAIGWPANFLGLPTSLLRIGENTITFTNNSSLGKREALFINQLEILIKPADAPFQFELAPQIVRAGEPFHIILRNTTGKQITITHSPGVHALACHTPPGVHALACHAFFTLQTNSLDNSQSITFRAGKRGEHSLTWQPTQVAHAPYPYDSLIGTDFDDDRHDETTLDILDFFHKTQMGNIIGFRSKLGRNCFERPAQPFWEQWFNFLHSRGLHCWNEDAARTTPWLLNEKLKSKFPALLASKYHEICNEIAHKAATYRNLKHANTEFQKLITERHEKLAIPDCPFWMSSGTAKILLVAAHPKIDMPIAEPTAHDHCFLYSTLRKTAPLHNKPWGSHIPIQWYMGTEHSEDKIRRFSLSLHLAHMMGAKLIYSESGLFKFVQYKRLDYDHPISRQARDAIRSFYIHTQLHPIPKPAKPLANINLLYGNLDSFFFFHDHTPIDTGKSNNRQLWYKWPFTHEDHAWQAARTLFPPTNNNELKGYPTDTHEPRFSSNPFGSVDIIPIADLLKNTLPLTILLGRNIMTPQILRSLTTYVKNGGTLFLSLHHFNTNPNPTTAPKYNPTQIAQLLGHQLRFTTTPKIHTHHLGKGTVHCYTGSRPMGHPTVRPFIDDCLRQLATQHRPAIHLTNNQPVYIQQYDLGNQVTQLNLLNLNWKHPHLPTCANLSLNGTTYPLPIPFGPPTFLVATPTFAIIPHSSTTQIYNFEGHDSAYSFSATGSGFETFTILQSPNHAITDLLIDGLPAPFYPTAQNENILKFSVPLTRQRAITIHHT